MTALLQLVRLLTVAICCSAEVFAQSEVRGHFSQKCAAYPGKRVVLVSVSLDYLKMFQNWYHFARPWLQDTEHLVVVAEDEAVAKPLRLISHNASSTGDNNPAFAVYVSSHPVKKSVNLRQRFFEPDAPLYDSQAFGDLVTQRATHMLTYLERGCTVLYSDIDNVWVKDPFRQIGLLPRKDLLATDDDPSNLTKTYACTCFLYMQPTQASQDLMHAWHDRSVGQSTNQRPFNEVLAEAKESYVTSFAEALLPFSEFPPGTNASQFPNATVIHANWIHGGLQKKIEFLEERGLWYGGRSAGSNAAQAIHRPANASKPQPRKRLIRLLLDNGPLPGWNSTDNASRAEVVAS